MNASSDGGKRDKLRPGVHAVALVTGLAMVAMCFAGLMQKQPFTKGGRIVGAVFSGLLQLQVLLGIGLVAGGLWLKRDIGHVVMMLAAVGLAMTMLRKNRKAAQPNWVRPLIGVGGALVLIAAGLLAILVYLLGQARVHHALLAAITAVVVGVIGALAVPLVAAGLAGLFITGAGAVDAALAVLIGLVPTIALRRRRRTARAAKEAAAAASGSGTGEPLTRPGV